MYKPIKNLGQNFLTDRNVVRKMVDSLDLRNGDIVVEIGPGHGALTEELAEALPTIESKIIAVDIDDRFTSKLNEMFVYQQNVEIVNDDILKWLPNFEPGEGKDFKILGSLPYYITSPIIHAIIKMKKQPSLCVLLVQKEVSDKIAAKAPDSSYMSAFVQTFYNVQDLGSISKKRFIPQPKVDGGIIKMVKKPGVSLDPAALEKYEGFLHRAFSTPRKMLNKPFKKEELELAGIDGRKRPQDLSADEWLRVYFTLT